MATMTDEGLRERLERMERGFRDEARHVMDPAKAALLVRQANDLAEVRAQLPVGAVSEIVQERIRQIRSEGFDAPHDDEHDDESLAMAAACYAAPEAIYREVNNVGVRLFMDPWPWIAHNRGEEVRDFTEWNKTGKSRRRQLVIAGALILAELERLDRAQMVGEGDDPARGLTEQSGRIGGTDHDSGEQQPEGIDNSLPSTACAAEQSPPPPPDREYRLEEKTDPDTGLKYVEPACLPPETNPQQDAASGGGLPPDLAGLSQLADRIDEVGGISFWADRVREWARTHRCPPCKCAENAK